MDVDHHRDRVVERVVDCAAVAFEKEPHEPRAKWFSSEAWALRGARCCALKVVEESHKTINNLIKDAFFKAWLRGCTPGKPFNPYKWFAQLDVECAAVVMHRAIAELCLKRSAANYQHILRLARKSYLESQEKEAHRAIEAGESRRLFAIVRDLRPKQKRRLLGQEAEVAAALCKPLRGSGYQQREGPAVARQGGLAADQG